MIEVTPNNDQKKKESIQDITTIAVVENWVLIDKRLREKYNKLNSFVNRELIIPLISPETANFVQYKLPFLFTYIYSSIS